MFEGLLVEDPNDGRPLITLADPEAVRAVYRGERRILRLTEPTKVVKAAKTDRPQRRDAADALTGGSLALFEALREWRRGEASRQHLPPYFIFNNDTLVGIALARPSTPEALSAIDGVGQGKLERYGEAVLAIVAGAT
jgi:ATP-dependent DNA helicase RecQ